MKKKKRRKLTRRQKMKAGPMTPGGRSQYALKVARRRRAAENLGLPGDATWPEIWETKAQEVQRDR